MDRPSKQKISKIALELYFRPNGPKRHTRTFLPTAVEYTFFPRAQGKFSRVDHMLRHKTSLNKFVKTEIISSIFSEHSCMKVEKNYRRKTKLKLNVSTQKRK